MTIKTISTVDGINVADFGNTVNKYYWFKNLGDTTIDYWGFAYSDGRNNFVLKL